MEDLELAESEMRDLKTKYQVLKRKYRELREEHVRALELIESSAKKVKRLSVEKKFLRNKLDSFLRSQTFAEENLYHTSDRSHRKSTSTAHQIALAAPPSSHSHQNYHMQNSAAASSHNNSGGLGQAVSSTSFGIVGGQGSQFILATGKTQSPVAQTSPPGAVMGGSSGTGTSYAGLAQA